jgi:ribosomal protein L11 methyltransferase
LGHPTLTYELRVTFTGEPGTPPPDALKRRLIDWLLVNGVESFVEGSLDVDINQNQDEPPRDHYGEMGGDETPVSIYRYSRESLDDLQAKLARDFATGVEVSLHSMPTEAWMEGWKESFRPFATPVFYVRPPWEPAAAATAGKKPLTDLVIEPGMAFGTGQHATTRLCLDLLGDVAKGKGERARERVLDVGTGTGILAIGAKKLGYGAVLGTDIEEDAILASVENARMNQTEVFLQRGSIPEGQTYELVLANILAVVLLRLMDELDAATAPGGHLILSGILVEEEDEVVARAARCGLRCLSRARQDGWSALLLAKHP